MRMPTFAKPPELIAAMRQAARIAVGTVEMIGAAVRPGISSAELDALCRRCIESQGGVAACIGCQGYAHATCISVNPVLCHGVPGPKLLKDGDLLNIDLVVSVDGAHADTSATFFAGRPGIAAARLARVTQEHRAGHRGRRRGADLAAGRAGSAGPLEARPGRAAAIGQAARRLSGRAAPA